MQEGSSIVYASNYKGFNSRVLYKKLDSMKIQGECV